MHEIYLNGEMQMIQLPMALDVFLQEQGMVLNYSAIAINRVFIPKSQYATTLLQAHDRIECVTPMQGG